MSRMISKRLRYDKERPTMRPAEALIFGLIVIGLVMAGRWYFLIYRQSPGFILGQYFGAVKAGNVERQYDLLSEMDKHYFTLSDYEKRVPQARGYTERIAGFNVGTPVPNPKDPQVAKVQATLSVRASADGQALYQNGVTQDATDTYMMRQDKDGAWKLWLMQSDLNHLYKIKPSPAGSSF